MFGERVCENSVHSALWCSEKKGKSRNIIPSLPGLCVSLDLLDYNPRLWPFRFLDWRNIVVAKPSDVSYLKRLSELSEQLLQSAKEERRRGQAVTITYVL